MSSFATSAPEVTEGVDVVVIGGGQAGLATAYYLRRAGLVPGEDFVILDAEERAGGAWQHMWDGLRLFSPSSYSSLPGWMMPHWDDASLGFPTRDHVVDYLGRYEERYALQVRRPHRVVAVERDSSGGSLLVRADGGDITARLVVSTTGTWTQPFWPVYPGAHRFAGRQLHAAQYRRPEDFAGQRVVVVGGGNSGAQILAEVSLVADTTWVTTRAPRFLPDDVDGRALFAAATARVEALRKGLQHQGVGGLGDVVMVPSVREARSRGALQARRMFSRHGCTSSDTGTGRALRRPPCWAWAARRGPPRRRSSISFSADLEPRCWSPGRRAEIEQTDVPPHGCAT